MATLNPFDILGDDDNDDPAQLIAAVTLEKLKKAAAPAGAQQGKPAAKLPSKPVPPAQAVREAKNDTGRGRGRGGDRGYGPGRGGGRPYEQDFGNEGGRYRGNDGFSGSYRPSEEGDGGKPYERRGGYRPSEEGDGGKPYERRGGYKPSEEGDGGKPYERRGGYRPSEEGDGGKPYERRGGYRPSEEGDGGRPYERRGGDGPRGPPRGGRRGGYSNGEVAEGERPRRTYDRHSATGRGTEFKRDGAGRGNWGTPTDEVAPEADEAVTEVEKNVASEKLLAEVEVVVSDADKEIAERKAKEEAERKAEVEAEEKKMTLEEYQKVLEEKRKSLLAEMVEERKVEVDKELKAMQQLSNKKANDEIFIKLGSEKDKLKDGLEKEEKAKKSSVSINEFLKPAEGERYGGRERSRGGARGGARGGGSYGGGRGNAVVPKIEDPGQFPSLAGK